ncbi:MAG: enoyl-CoA hydratase [Syntrophales bacterium]|jgi:enoyl-CoA hydratase/carnithine racemase|nr:enoyl-CoA hydratase [Syntrophales bacterium]
MTFETILYDVADEIATITLNRPSKLNSYTPKMGNELVDALTQADEDPGVRVVVLTGAGRAFCAGADIGSFAEDIDTRAAGGTGQHSNQRIKYYPTLMQRFSKPTIAAINGYSLGIGCTLTLSWDMRIIAEDAKMGVTFPRVGLMMELGSTYLLPRLIGVSNAAEMMLTGRHFTAEECHRKGLVSYVVPGDKLMEKVREIADEMLQCSPTSLAYTRRALYDGLRGSLENACSFETLGMEHCYLSPEHKEYVSAFMEKRKPDFRRVK